MRTLRKSELELDGEVFVDCDTLDREELLGRWFTNDKPPVRHLLEREVGRDNSLIVVGIVLVCVSCETDGDKDWRTCCVVALRELVVDVECRVRVDKCGNITPGRLRHYELKIRENLKDKHLHLPCIHSQE